MMDRTTQAILFQPQTRPGGELFLPNSPGGMWEVPLDFCLNNQYGSFPTQWTSQATQSQKARWKSWLYNFIERLQRKPSVLKFTHRVSRLTFK